MIHTTHSPGPWVVGGEKYDDWGLVRGADGMPVATAGVSARIPDDARVGHCPVEIAANAALIAAAPEMLDLLREYASYYGTTAAFRKLQARGDAIIAKATGSPTTKGPDE